MYGAVPIRHIKQTLLDFRKAGTLNRVRLVLLTNCTFDGIVYDVERVMMECLAIKPDLVFLWDEAWFAFACCHPIYRQRTGMASAKKLAESLQTPEYASALRRVQGRLPRRGLGRRREAARTPGCCPTRPRPGCASTPPTRRTRR